MPHRETSTSSSPLELSATVDFQACGDAISKLENGDILITSADVNGEIVVRAGGVPKFSARLGACDGKRAASINRRIRQDDESR